MIGRHLKICRLGIGKTRAKLLRLLMHVHHQLRPIDSIGKSGEIFDQRRGGKLAARLPTLEHERFQIGSRGIDCRGQSRASAPDNDHLLHARQE